MEASETTRNTRGLHCFGSRGAVTTSVITNWQEFRPRRHPVSRASRN